MFRVVALTRIVTVAAAFGGSLAAAHATPVVYTPGTYTYVAPTAGDYTLEAIGGQGGTTYGGNGGYGADALGTFALTAGEQLGIVVGSAGPYYGTSAGGAGGSFVYVTASNSLLVAGGGGGGSSALGGAGGNASTAFSALSESGGSVAGVNGTDGTCCGINEHAGSGGLSDIDTSLSDGYVSGASITVASGGGGGLVYLSAPVAVPEPESASLLGTGLVILACRRYRRSRPI